MYENNTKPTLDYLHEMGIDIWIPRTMNLSCSSQEKSLLDAISLACQMGPGSIQISQVEVQQLLREPLLKKSIWLRLKDNPCVKSRTSSFG